MRSSKHVRSKSELAVAAWGALTLGALLASYTAFRPVRDALILDGDPEQLPWLFTATFIAVTIVSPIWGAAVRKAPRRVVPYAFHAFALCLVGFAIVVHAAFEPLATGRVFYVWSAVFNLFVISVFWSLLADLLGPTAAWRLYGPIAAGGTAGAIAGPALTTLLVHDIGVHGVLVVSAVLLELAVVGVAQIRRVAEPHADADEPLPRANAFEGMQRVAKSPYLATIVGYVLCTACAATFVYLAQAGIAKAAIPNRVERTEFFANIDLWVAIGTMVVQTFVAAPLIGWLGPGLVLCALPIIQGIGITTLVLAPSLTTLVVLQVASRTATHGLTRPARELLFTVVPRDDKYRAKNVIDTVVYRGGDFGSAWLDRGLVALHAGGLAIVGTTIPLAVIWLVLALAAGAGFRARTKEKTS